MFIDDINELLNKFNGRYELIEFNADNYLKNGFCIVLKKNFGIALTQKEFNFRSAKARIEGDNLIVRGFLNDIEQILAMLCK